MKTHDRIILFVLMFLFAISYPLTVGADSADDEIQAELQAADTCSSAPPLNVSDGKDISSSKTDTGGAVIYSSDFESDNGGMSGTQDWEWGDYDWVGDSCSYSNVPPPSAHSGTRMWGTKLNTCYSNLGNNQGHDTCINTDKSDDSILSLTVDLTGIGSAQLIWWEWYDVFGTWDWAEVYANDVVVFQKCGISWAAPTSWVKQVVDLTPFAGGPVTIEFHMMASTVVNYSGWFIDDVEVLGTKKALPFVPLLLLND